MIDITYIISDSFRCYSGSTISIGGLGYDKLKDKDQDTFISDCITHEFIHAILEDTFNRTASQLFDFIGDTILNKKVLRCAVCLTSNDALWTDMVKEKGVQWIYDEYMIDNIRLIQAYLICNGV